MSASSVIRDRIGAALMPSYRKRPTALHRGDEKAAWVREDASSLMRTFDRVLGGVSAILVIISLGLWGAGLVSAWTVFLQLALPALNFPISVLSKRDLMFGELVRTALNMPLLAVMYLSMDGVFEHFWLGHLSLCVAQSLVLTMTTRRIFWGVAFSVFYASTLLLATLFLAEPDWHITAGHAVALVVIGVLISIIGRNLGETMLAARTGRDEAIASKRDLEATLRRLADAQMRLVSLSRMAGMAEVATGVLHNVGNVLNSVNVSNQVINEALDGSKLTALGDVARMLASRSADLPTFLTDDPKGRMMIPILGKLVERLGAEHASIRTENLAVRERIEHIKVIVGRQQRYAKSDAVNEECSVGQLIDEAAALTAGTFADNGIAISRELGQTPVLRVDRHQILQILINLLSNAKHAVQDANRSDGAVALSSGVDDLGRVYIRVRDNGVGIPEANMSRIFQHGFTTRAEGHGFGLHGAGNAARALGGELTCTSDGPGTGATFTLTLPVEASAKAS
jgi:signal transduction histidine kinase